jgi:hypothetical protein
MITHPVHGRDDLANSIAGAVDLIVGHFGYDRLYRGWDPSYKDPDLPPTPTDREPSAAQSRLVDLYRGIAACFGPSLPNPPFPRPLPPCNRSADGNWWKQR